MRRLSGRLQISRGPAEEISLKISVTFCVWFCCGCLILLLFSFFFVIVFRTLRYEDLSLDPYDMAQELLQFYGLPFDLMVEEFLDTHTKVNIGGVSSTYRDSKSAPFHWKQDLKAEDVS